MQQQDKAQPNVQKCSTCHDKGFVYCGGLVVRQGNSHICCSCLKYTGDKIAIGWSHCMRELKCKHCQIDEDEDNGKYGSK